MKNCFKANIIIKFVTFIACLVFLSGCSSSHIVQNASAAPSQDDNGNTVVLEASSNISFDEYISKSAKEIALRLEKKEVEKQSTEQAVEPFSETATPSNNTGVDIPWEKAPKPDVEWCSFDSFIHGTKPVQNQQYIMIHDTEGEGEPINVAQSWSNSNNGAVAAHFVIGRDGHIVQCGELDQILHHAGWGGPGDYDDIFDVGNNDGTGDGDDLVGVVPLDGYTSYGMNSHSIGIELVHVGGQDYPDEQLEALDALIAYIDDYYGFEAEIIDHKTWRPSNSDTDMNFAPYLESYQDHRKHE